MKKEIDWMAVILRVAFIVVFIGLIYGFDSAIGYSNKEDGKENVTQNRELSMASDEFSHIVISDSDADVLNDASGDISVDLNNNAFQKLLIIILTGIGLLISLLVFCELVSRVQ